jgi:HK97 family phage major capsid protein
VNEENINKLFAELATKANSDDAVNKAEVESLYNEIKSLRDEQAAHAAQIEAANEALARKSATKSQASDEGNNDLQTAIAFVKGRFAVEDGDIKATEFSRMVNVEGGHSIPTVVDAEVTRELNKQSVIRGLSRVVSVKGNYERLIKFKTSGAAKTKAEKAAYTLNTTDTFAKLHWSFTDVTDQQRHTAWVSDEPESFLNLKQELLDSMILNISEKESDHFLNGTTQNRVEDVEDITSTPMGILAHTLSTGEVNRFTSDFGTLATVRRPTTELLSDSLLELRATLHASFHAGAVFVISSDAERILMKEKDNNGRAVWAPADSSITSLPGGLVHGMRYVVDDLMPTVAEAIAAGTPVALLANFQKAYTIADYGTMKWVQDPITEPQYVKYSARRRSGAAIVDYKAIRALVVAGS